MEATAKVTYVRMSPRKIKIVLDLIRNKPVDEALAILKYTPNAASEPTFKLLKSAIANAENNFNLDPAMLYVSYASVGSAPTLKRMRARAKGSGTRINKKASHITLTVKEAQ